jgi:hypothetical protein
MSDEDINMKTSALYVGEVLTDEIMMSMTF